MTTVHHRFLRYRAFPGAQSFVGLVNKDETSVSAILNPATGKGYSELFDIIEDHPLLSAEHRFQLVSGSERSISQVETLAPLPGKDIICIGKNYVEHAREFNLSGFDASDKKDQPDHPVFFTKRASSIVPNGHPIHLHPNVSSCVDYEGELGIIIGKGGTGIKKENAWQHVWGAVIINDVTARERQRDHKQFFIGKSLDTFCPMGAYVIPSSSLSFSDLHLTTKVNGEIRQSQNTSELIFDVPTLIETASMGITIQPGDVIATGTPYGTGMATRTWLKEGDIVEISITPLGTLRSPVASLNSPSFLVDLARIRTSIGDIQHIDAHRVLVGSPGKVLHVEVSGPEEAPPVLFFHGLGSSLQSYKGAIERAGLTRNRRVVLLDLEGHGQSPLSPQSHKGLSIGQFADDAKALLDTLGMKTAHVVGHSLGGLIATTFAAKYPEVVKNMVLFAPANHLSDTRKQALRKRVSVARSSGMTVIADLLTDPSLSSHTHLMNPVAKMFVHQSISNTHLENYVLACLALANAPDPDLSRIQAEKVVIVAGRDDKSITGDIIDFLQSSIHGSRVIWWDNIGHWHMVEDVERTAKVFVDFL